MKLISAVFVLLASFAGVLAAQDMNLTGAGARAEGLGGAFIGVADDATAIVWNPAGLTQLERAEASVVTRFISEKAEYNYTFFPSDNSTIDQSHVQFNFGSIALPFKLGSTSLVIAAAYQRQLDFYSNVKFGSVEQEGKGGADTFTPGLGVKLTPVISVGVSANIWTGTYDLTQKSTGIASTLTLTQNLKYKGFNMVIGGMVDLEALPQPVPIKLGVTLRTPFELTADGTQNYSSGFSPNTEYTAKRTVQMPMMIGFGTSFRLSENFTLAADYELRSYGDREVTDELSGSGAATKTTSPVSESKENLNQFRAGAEYLIVLKKHAVPIRIGYKTMPTLFADQDENGQNGAQVVGKAYSVGSGYISDAFAVDLSYTMADYTQTYAGSGSIKYTVGTLGASLIIYM